MPTEFNRPTSSGRLILTILHNIGHPVHIDRYFNGPVSSGRLILTALYRPAYSYRQVCSELQLCANRDQPPYIERPIFLTALYRPHYYCSVQGYGEIRTKYDYSGYPDLRAPRDQPKQASS